MKIVKFSIAEFLTVADNHYGIIIMDVMLVVRERSTEPAFYLVTKINLLLNICQLRVLNQYQWCISHLVCLLPRGLPCLLLIDSLN